MDLLTVGCVATVVVVAAGVTVYVNRKRRRAIAAMERRREERRQPPVTETRGPFSVDPLTQKVTVTGSKVHDTGPQDIARKPAPLERHGREARVAPRPSRSTDRQDPIKRRNDDSLHSRRRSEDSSGDDLALGMGLGYLAGSSESERSRDTFSGNGGSFGGGGASSSWGGDSSSSCSSSSSDSSSSSSDSGSSSCD